MLIHHPDYIKLVMRDYDRRKASNQLSSLLLANPTPANLRDACIQVYKTRYDKKDDSILMAFFGVASPEHGFLRTIERVETDRFKPLQRYLKREIATTNDRNINLLAWLIDFKPRPYYHGIEILKSDLEMEDSIEKNNGTVAGPITSTEQPGNSHQVDDEPEVRSAVTPEETTHPGYIRNNTGRKPKIFSRNILSRAAAVFAFAGASFVIWREIKAGASASPSGETGCMYWADTAYVQVPCDEQRNGMLTLPLDIDKIKSFKKITNTDTITERSIGRIYYLKSHNALELFTAGGNHPVEVTRNLHKLSEHMFDKYLSKGKKPKVSEDRSLAALQIEN